MSTGTGIVESIHIAPAAEDKGLAELIHFCCTSEDVNNLSYALMVKGAVEQVWLPKAQALVKNLDSGQGVLVLSDIYGATPCNIVTKLLTPDETEGVAGVNLPMLVRVLNYRHEGLHSCIQKALSGGRDGVVHFTKTTCHHAQ